MQTTSGKGCVLVVEDHADTLRYLTRLLRMQGYAVHEATNCHEALDVMARERCDVLVSDIGLPDATGLDLMRTLRERQPGVHGVAVSGFTGRDETIAAREAGFGQHFSKPLNFNALLAHIRQLLAVPPGGVVTGRDEPGEQLPEARQVEIRLEPEI